MDAQNIRIGCRFGVEKIFARGDGVLCQLVGDETVFLRGEHMGAEVQIIALVINELEGQTTLNMEQRKTEGGPCKRKPTPSATKETGELHDDQGWHKSQRYISEKGARLGRRPLTRAKKTASPLKG